ncbi:MAG TPA: fumarate hydratase C-terminal domain-containing protein [Gaiellaceae bacterium]|nr:fumarate hydratase C-terminal domain-containing protein [Gaiellaceae bacterium]
MSSKRLTFPATEEAIRELRAGDEVLVDGHIIGIRDRTQIRIFDQGVAPPLDLNGAFLLHTAPGVRKIADLQESAASPPAPSELAGRPATNVNPARSTAKYEKVCIGTTTSARMVRFTEPLGRDYGVRAICGKGGLPDEAIEPMREHGMVYFAIVGGAAALETTQIEEIEEVYWEELMPECLWKFRVKDFGPLTVGIDSHGNSLFHDVQERAKAKLEELYERL